MSQSVDSEDDLIDEIMNKLKDEDSIRVQKSGPLNQNDSRPILEEDQGLALPLYSNTIGLIESADIVLEDGLNINDVVGQEMVFAENSLNQIENNSFLLEQQIDSSSSRSNNSIKEHNKSEFFDDNEQDPDDPDFVFNTSEDNSYDSEHHIVFNEDPEERNETTNEGNQILVQESQRPLEEEMHGLSEREQQVEENEMGKKRKRNKKPVPSEWEVNRQKRLRMTGKKYIGFTRKKVGERIKVEKIGERKERKLGPSCNSRICNANKKRRCSEFSEDDRNNIFKAFWALSWSEKETFVRSFITKTKPKRRTGVDPNNSRRKGTFTYFLRHEGDNKPVCKKLFLNTLAIKEWMAHNWCNKETDVLTDDVANIQPSEGNINNLQEGSRYGKKSEKEKVIEEWFDSLPKVPSHYCRKSSTKLYLEPVWDSKRAMYHEYKNHSISMNKPWGSLTMFMTIFERKNLSIFVPKKDQCDMCSAYKAGNISKEKYDEHQKQKERAREEKENDKKQAIEEKIYCLTVDVEAVKLTPITRASAMYYKTKLCSHNYTVYNLSTKHCTCYWFNEVEGDLSGNTFASCITHYLKEHCLNPPRPIIIYSDGATNQNRNQILSNALLHFAVQNSVQITQKFLIKGHTHMEGDFVHAKIEEKLKGKEVYVPHEYVRYTQMARQKPFPYNTEYLTHDFFKDFSKVSYYDSIRPGRSKGDPVVVDLHWLEYDSKEITIKYKLNFDDDLKPLPRRAMKVSKDTQPSRLFKNRLPLPESK